MRGADNVTPLPRNQPHADADMAKLEAARAGLKADVASGQIVIQAVTGRSHVRLAWDWYAKFFKLSSRDQTTEEFRGKTLRLDTRPHQRISIDGEILARTPVTVAVAEKAIEVVVPAEG